MTSVSDKEIPHKIEGENRGEIEESSQRRLLARREDAGWPGGVGSFEGDDEAEERARGRTTTTASCRAVRLVLVLETDEDEGAGPPRCLGTAREEGGRDNFRATATAALGSDPDRERGERGMKGEMGSVLGFARGREGNLICAGRRQMAATAAWCGHGWGISATTPREQEEGERGA